MDGGLQITADAVAQETARQSPPQPLGGNGQQIGLIITRLIVRRGFRGYAAAAGVARWWP